MRFRSYIVKEFVVTNVLRRFAQGNARFAPRMVIASNDYIGHWINVAGGYELQLLNPAIAFLAGKGYTARPTCIDVGANIGNHAVFFSQHFSRVLAIEANPTVFRLLEFNAQGRPITCRNVAAGASDGQVAVMIPDPTNEGTGQVRLDRAPCSDSAVVPLRTLDEIAQGHDQGVGLIKIDVEGMEQDVLRGASDIIRRNSPAILFEYHRHLQKHADTFDILSNEYGYTDFYYVAPRFDFRRFGNVVGDIADVALNFLANSPFVVRRIDRLKTRSYDFVIATKG